MSDPDAARRAWVMDAFRTACRYDVLAFKPGNVSVETEGKRIDTGLRKFGALLGDKTDIGCNSVLNPGAVGPIVR